MLLFAEATACSTTGCLRARTASDRICRHVLRACHAGDGKGIRFPHAIRQSNPSETSTSTTAAATPEQGPSRLHSRTTLAPSTRLTPPAVTGLGFLEAVPDSFLLSLADPDDIDGDGISGALSWIDLPAMVTPRPAPVTENGKYIGRFGKKAAVYNLFQQTVNAYNQDIGITSSFLPNNPVNPADGVQPVPATTPEVTEEEINAVVFYLQTLKTPIRRRPNDPTTIRGEALFTQAGCGGCHTPVLRTGPSPIAALANREIRRTRISFCTTWAALDDATPRGAHYPSSGGRRPWGLGLSPNSQEANIF